MALDVVMDAVGATVAGRDIHSLVASPVECDALGQKGSKSVIELSSTLSTYAA